MRVPPTIVECQSQYSVSDYVLLNSVYENNIEGVCGFRRSFADKQTVNSNMYPNTICGIVSCGGLCLGMNNIIFNLVKLLNVYC